MSDKDFIIVFLVIVIIVFFAILARLVFKNEDLKINNTKLHHALYRIKSNENVPPNERFSE